uniref:Uncharacterized protein n=1 Tax=Candidatus Methanophagaceae archaeon ANME-1 ERB6 TaxID=2759912 RepID=A0A7G9YRW9_9EURY|nr:hypothetical protein HAICDJOK_00013 [Methanosarcinales archaeon ANME-1 ERB6]
MGEKAIKKMIMRKVLSCLVIIVILMSAVPVSVLASNSSDDVMDNALDSLSEVDTHEDIVVSGVDNVTYEAGCNFSDGNITGNTSKSPNETLLEKVFTENNSAEVMMPFFNNNTTDVQWLSFNNTVGEDNERKIVSAQGESLSISVWTDKSEYKIGETVTIYYQTNKKCNAKLTITKPDGKKVVYGPNEIPKCTRSKSPTAGYPTGKRTVVFEAWAGDEYKKATCYFDVKEKGEEEKWDVIFEGTVIGTVNPGIENFICEAKIDKIISGADHIEEGWTVNIVLSAGDSPCGTYGQVKKGDKIKVYGQRLPVYSWPPLISLCGRSSYYLKKISSESLSIDVWTADAYKNTKTEFKPGDNIYIWVKTNRPVTIDLIVDIYYDSGGHVQKYLRDDKRLSGAGEYKNYWTTGEPGRRVLTLKAWDDYGNYAEDKWTFYVKESKEKPSPKITDVDIDPPICVKEGEYATISVTVKNKGGASSEGYISVSFPNDEYIPTSSVSGTGNGYNELYPKGHWPLWNSEDKRMTAVDPLVELKDTNWRNDQEETITMNVKPNSGSDEIVFYVRAALKNDADGSYERDLTYSSYKDQQGWYVKKYSVDVCEGENIPVKFIGEITGEGTPISSYEFDVRVDEILSDPDGKLEVGETVSVWAHKSAFTIEAGVGDRVEVFGLYKGTFNDKDKIQLEDSAHFLEEQAYRWIKTDENAKFDCGTNNDYFTVSFYSDWLASQIKIAAETGENLRSISPVLFWDAGQSEPSSVSKHMRLLDASKGMIELWPNKYDEVKGPTSRVKIYYRITTYSTEKDKLDRIAWISTHGDLVLLTGENKDFVMKVWGDNTDDYYTETRIYGGTDRFKDRLLMNWEGNVTKEYFTVGDEINLDVPSGTITMKILELKWARWYDRILLEMIKVEYEIDMHESSNILPVPYYNQGHTKWCLYYSFCMLLRYNNCDVKPWEIADYFDTEHDDSLSKFKLYNEFDHSLEDFSSSRCSLTTKKKIWGLLGSVNTEDFDNYIKESIDTGQPVLTGFSKLKHVIVAVGYDSQYIYLSDPSGAITQEVFNNNEKYIAVPVLWSDFNEKIVKKIGTFNQAVTLKGLSNPPSNTPKGSIYLTDYANNDDGGLYFQNRNDCDDKGALRFDGKYPDGYRIVKVGDLPVERTPTKNDIMSLGFTVANPTSTQRDYTVKSSFINSDTGITINRLSSVWDLSVPPHSTDYKGSSYSNQLSHIDPGDYTLVIKLFDDADTELDSLQFDVTVAENPVEKYALIIGAGGKHPINSAKVMYNLLHDGYGYDNIVLLTGDDATWSNIVNNISRLSVVPDPNDDVIFYFAGHGGTGLFGEYITSDDGEEINELSLGGDLNDIEGLTAIFDSCCSGGLVGEYGIAGDDKVILMSCRSDESAYSPSIIDEYLLERRHDMIFSYYLNKAFTVNKADADKLVTENERVSVEEAFMFAKDKTTNYVNDRYHHQQHPEMKDNYLSVDNNAAEMYLSDNDPSFLSASTNCPVNLHAYDPQGRHIGINASGGIDEEIPGSYYTGPDFDPEEIIIIGTTENIIYKIEALDVGEFDFTVTQSTEIETTTVTYLDVPISETTEATVDVSQENPTYTMEIDKYGDGTTIETKKPDSIETIGCTYDHDGDGIVEDDLDDLMLATDAYLGFNTGSEYDADGDGTVEDDIDDLIMATDAYLGFITCEGAD